LSSETLSFATAKRLYDQAALLAKVGAWECELARETLSWTDGVYDLFGLARGSTLHRPSIVDLYHDESRSEMERLRSQAIRQGGGFTLDARIRTGAGEERWMRLSAQVAHEHARPVRIFGAKQDITHEKAMWASLRQLAYTDALTGLANRRAFENLCDDLHKRGIDAATAALVIVDVDNFKPINDAFGHAAGDECLRQIAVRLGQALDDSLMTARIGGDEFAVMLRTPFGRPHLALMLQHVLRVLSCPVFWNGLPIEIGVSIGAAVVKAAHRGEPARLFAEADSALYLAKASGRNQVRLYGDAVEAAIRPASRGGDAIVLAG
jgi:diguanylate cyclase (GGDEF)-like protein/PAS domain S-box-containing protein